MFIGGMVPMPKWVVYVIVLPTKKRDEKLLRVSPVFSIRYGKLMALLDRWFISYLMLLFDHRKWLIIRGSAKKTAVMNWSCPSIFIIWKYLSHPILRVSSVDQVIYLLVLNAQASKQWAVLRFQKQRFQKRHQKLYYMFISYGITCVQYLYIS